MTFADFYRTYPHKKGRSKKREAHKHWRKITGLEGLKVPGEDEPLKATPERIITAAKAYYDCLFQEYCRDEKASCFQDFCQFVPAAQAWLYQGRWEDWEEEETEGKVVHLNTSA